MLTAMNTKSSRKKLRYICGTALNLDLCETIRVKEDTSATLRSEETPYMVVAGFVSGREIVIGRFKVFEAAQEYVRSFTD